MLDDLRELYQEVILDHGKSPRNFRDVEDATAHAHGANPLCGDILGTLIPAGEMCQDPGLWAGCIEVGAGCPAVEVVAEDAEGNCWVFPSGCVPSEGFTASDSCPDSSVTDGYPACGG